MTGIIECSLTAEHTGPRPRSRKSLGPPVGLSTSTNIILPGINPRVNIDYPERSTGEKKRCGNVERLERGASKVMEQVLWDTPT